MKFHDIIDGVTMRRKSIRPPVRKPSSSSSTRKTCIRRSSSSTITTKPMASYPIPVRRSRRRDRRRQNRRRHAHGEDAAQEREDEGHHRRSAACRRAFEARHPKDASEISKIDGVVDFGPSVRGKRCIVIKDQQTGTGRGTPHPDRQARHRVQGRLREEGPAADGRSDRSARDSGHLRTAGACRNIWSTKCRKFIASRV